MADDPDKRVSQLMDRAPARPTRPCKTYIGELMNLMGFFAFVAGLAKTTDLLARAAADLVSTEFPESAAAYQEIGKRGAGAGGHFLNHRQLFSQMILCRGVDNFLTYITELMTLIFSTKPETLRSGEQVRLDYILQFESMSDLTMALVERRVNALSYQGMDDLSDELAQRIGLQLFMSDRLRQKAIRLIEMRNVIVHNRGIVSRTFVRRIPEAALEAGKPLRLMYRAVLEDLLDLAEIVFELDPRAAEKFGLETSGERDLLSEEAAKSIAADMNGKDGKEQTE